MWWELNRNTKVRETFALTWNGRICLARLTKTLKRAHDLLTSSRTSSLRSAITQTIDSWSVYTTSTFKCVFIFISSDCSAYAHTLRPSVVCKLHLVKFVHVRLLSGCKNHCPLSVHILLTISAEVEVDQNALLWEASILTRYGVQTVKSFIHW